MNTRLPSLNTGQPARRRPSGLLTLMIPAIIAVGCDGGRSAPTAPGAVSPVVQAYLDEMLAIMEAHSVNRLKIDWRAFRSSVMTAAGTAQTVATALPAIETALRLLGDDHSFYRPVTGPGAVAWTRPCGGPSSGLPLLPATVGYVKIGGFSGVGAEATAFANAIQQRIADADRDGLAGWVVDLRGNTGGNMWPMLAGVGPVLGEGVVGYFIDPVGTESAWEYRNGASWDGGERLQGVDAPYRLRRGAPRVAVLIDNGTVSSGEAVAIAFQRRPDTRFFGTATCGRSTANMEYKLSDGASLFLTEAIMADRMKTMYGGNIAPDEEVFNPVEVEQRAVAWLQAPG
jgi:carboxyl-terminal processing protease